MIVRLNTDTEESTIIQLNTDSDSYNYVKIKMQSNIAAPILKSTEVVLVVAWCLVGRIINMSPRAAWKQT